MTRDDDAANALAHAVERSQRASDALDAARTDRRETKSAVHEALRNFAATASPAEKAEVARDLYWERAHIDESTIQGGPGYPSRDAMIKATNYQPTHVCPRCTKVQTQTHRDIPVLRSAIEYPEKVCEDCAIEIRDEFIKQANASDAAYLDRLAREEQP